MGQRLGMGTNMYLSSTLLGQNKDESIFALPIDELIEKAYGFVGVFSELLVDLMRFPGQLIPQSTKAIFMTHIFGAGESDSAENDSCDSPLELNSPLYGFSERMDNESSEKDDNLHYQRRLE